MSDQLPDDAITAAIRAYNESYLTSNQSNPRFVAKVVTAALEAAAPAIAARAAATERERIIAELRDRAASERDEAITTRSPSAAERHIHAGAALDAAADLLDGAQ